MRRIIIAMFVLMVSVIALTKTSEAKSRSLTLYNTHTKERVTVTYKRNGRFLQSGLARLNRFLRDWRRDEVRKMDPNLFDLIWEVYRESGSRKPIHVVSGYRSPTTNNMLRKRTRGVAKTSQHMRGHAMDFFLPDVKVSKLRAIALKKQVGGVGYYPTSRSPFVHLDTGRVRHWPKMTRKQLVKLFPRGKTLHIPTDGRKMAGYEKALTVYNKRNKKKPIIVASREVKRKSRTPQVARSRPVQAKSSQRAPVKVATAPVKVAGAGEDNIVRGKSSVKRSLFAGLWSTPSQKPVKKSAPSPKAVQLASVAPTAIPQINQGKTEVATPASLVSQSPKSDDTGNQPEGLITPSTPLLRPHYKSFAIAQQQANEPQKNNSDNQEGTVQIASIMPAFSPQLSKKVTTGDVDEGQSNIAGGDAVAVPMIRPAYIATAFAAANHHSPSVTDNATAGLDKDIIPAAYAPTLRSTARDAVEAFITGTIVSQSPSNSETRQSASLFQAGQAAKVRTKAEHKQNAMLMPAYASIGFESRDISPFLAQQSSRTRQLAILRHPDRKHLTAFFEQPATAIDIRFAATDVKPPRTDRFTGKAVKWVRVVHF